MLTRRPPAGRRAIVAAAVSAGVAAALLAGCEEAPPRDLLVVTPDSVLATYPDTASDDGPALGNLSSLAVADGEVYVADQFSGRVHRFAADGSHLNPIGRKGEGPGELQRPTEVEVGPAGDVWVADPPSGRVTRFRSTGELVSTRRAPFGATDFGLLPGDRILVPSPTPDRLFAVVGPGNGITELGPGPDVPSSLASLEPADRFGFMATFLETDPATGEVYFMVNRADHALWDLRVDEDAGSVARAARLDMPGWLEDVMAKVREEQEAGLAEAGLQFIPFNDLQLTAAGLWATTGPIAALGVALRPVDGERPVAVLPAAGDVRSGGPFEGLRHASLEPGGLYAVYPTRVRVFSLDTVGVRSDPDLP